MKIKTKGPRTIRLLAHLCTVILGVLIFWLLGFLVEDIESLPGPDREAIERSHVDQALVRKQQELEKRTGGLERQLESARQQQRLVGEGAENLHRTIDQLLEIRRLSIEKAAVLPEGEKGSLSASLSQFLQDQKTYQELNHGIADLTSKKLRLEEDSRLVAEKIEAQKRSADEDFEQKSETHRVWLAFYQLALLVPLLLVAGGLLLRLRGSVYLPLFLAFGGATLLKVALVVHEYFPTRYFKYVLILVLLAVVARLLVYLIRIIVFPKLDWLLRQYREAYERFLCPVCEYPIRTGPRKFLYWTRRTVHKVLPPAEAEGKSEPYTCPSCGTPLFEECPACHNVRHSLLGHCAHCGTEKELQY
jgi:predicted RNA-binding Zn-ribbon protein involved in translation (DUF1610 family)